MQGFLQRHMQSKKKSLYINDCHCNAFGFICILLHKVYFNIVDGGWYAGISVEILRIMLIGYIF